MANMTASINKRVLSESERTGVTPFAKQYFFNLYSIHKYARFICELNMYIIFERNSQLVFTYKWRIFTRI